MSQLLDSGGTIIWILTTFLIVLGVIWQIQSFPDDDIGKVLAAPQSRPNQAGAGDDLRHRIEDIEKQLDAYRKRIIRIERTLRGGGIIFWALICMVGALYAIGRNDWVPGICFLAMALAFGTYGLVNVFSNEKGRWWGRSG
jgi:hypothetical protein